MQLRLHAARRLSGTPALRGAAGLLLCVLAAGAAGTACRPREAPPAVTLDWTVRPDPPRVGPATFAFTLSDTTGGPVAGAVVRLEATMTHPGMKPVPGAVTEIGPGHYAASLAFTMGGDWVMLIDATLPDGRSLHEEVFLPAVVTP